MAFSIKRLRWVLAAAAVLLIVVLTAYIGYGRYLAQMVYTRLLKRAGVTVSHDTNGVTYSQTRKGRTIFTLHAKTATQLGAGMYDLHGVNVTLFSADGKHTDYITGDEFTYDEKEGLVKAIGEVHMDLVAPQSLTASHSKTMSGEPPQTNQESAEVIHVRTSGLEYLRKLGVASTKEQVEFHYSGIDCTATGAEFDVDESTLHLLSDVVAHGLLHGQPVTIHAANASVDRTSNVATLERSVAQSKDKTASADVTTLDLRKDGSIASAKAAGHVVLTGATQKITSAELDATFTTETVPQTAKLTGGVQMIDSNALRPTNGSAAMVDILFDAKGAPALLTATGSPKMMLTDKRAVDRGLIREMHGDRIVAQFVSVAKGKHTDSQISDLHVTGSAETHGESLAGVPKGKSAQGIELPLKLTTLTADDLDMTFVAGAEGKSEPQKLAAVGHTMLRQQAPAGEAETSAGDKLDAVFAQTQTNGRAQLGLASAVQTGHVVVHRAGAVKAGAAQQFGSATADRASYDGGSEKLTLTGSAHLTQDNTTVTAATVVLDERTQDADAVGAVEATLEGDAAKSAPRPAPFTHVLAASAHFAHESKQAEFHGTDAQPAKMWQDASQVQAATLLLDNAKRTFAARGAGPTSLIHAVLAGASSSTASTPKAAGRARYVRVAAAKLDYSDAQREAVFSGPQGVTMEAESGTIRAERAVAYLQSATEGLAREAAGAKVATATAAANASPLGGSLDHIVITGDVQLDQPGRHGTGEQLVYTAATGESVLTGTPARMPKIVDAQQGSITGSSLLFGDAGSTIIVSGESSASKPVRVHTETHIEPKSDNKNKRERQ
jgi:lipopolysaccharide export system protein LptA